MGSWELESIVTLSSREACRAYTKNSRFTTGGMLYNDVFITPYYLGPDTRY